MSGGRTRRYRRRSRRRCPRTRGWAAAPSQPTRRGPIWPRQRGGNAGMPYASSGDAKIYYEVHGAGPAVLLLHGSGGHHAAWWQQVAALSGSYTVITVDLRG